MAPNAAKAIQIPARICCRVIGYSGTKECRHAMQNHRVNRALITLLTPPSSSGEKRSPVLTFPFLTLTATPRTRWPDGASKHQRMGPWIIPSATKTKWPQPADLSMSRNKAGAGLFFFSHPAWAGGPHGQDDHIFFFFASLQIDRLPTSRDRSIRPPPCVVPRRSHTCGPCAPGFTS